ncbi:hypothetical protein OIY81_2076 [Cryptosporidium canis]|nr:hypothetical protein OIY81_2076 [Cryptosporidium canis]
MTSSLPSRVLPLGEEIPFGRRPYRFFGDSRSGFGQSLRAGVVCESSRFGLNGLYGRHIPPEELKVWTVLAVVRDINHLDALDGLVKPEFPENVLERAPDVALLDDKDLVEPQGELVYDPFILPVRDDRPDPQESREVAQRKPSTINHHVNGLLEVLDGDDGGGSDDQNRRQGGTSANIVGASLLQAHGNQGVRVANLEAAYLIRVYGEYLKLGQIIGVDLFLGPGVGVEHSAHCVLILELPPQGVHRVVHRDDRELVLMGEPTLDRKPRSVIKDNPRDLAVVDYKGHEEVVDYGFLLGRQVSVKVDFPLSTEKRLWGRLEGEDLLGNTVRRQLLVDLDTDNASDLLINHRLGVEPEGQIPDRVDRGMQPAVELQLIRSNYGAELFVTQYFITEGLSLGRRLRRKSARNLGELVGLFGADFKLGGLKIQSGGQDQAETLAPLASGYPSGKVLLEDRLLALYEGVWPVVEAPVCKLTKVLKFGRELDSHYRLGGFWLANLDIRYNRILTGADGGENLLV